MNYTRLIVDHDGGYDRLVVRRYPMRHLCGYVRVPTGHPLHGIPYNECPIGCSAESYCRHSPESLFHVHGGVTFGDFHPVPEVKGFWYGFDYMHGFDDGRTTEAEVEEECADLARQLAAYRLPPMAEPKVVPQLDAATTLALAAFPTCQRCGRTMTEGGLRYLAAYNATRSYWCAVCEPPQG